MDHSAPTAALLRRAGVPIVEAWDWCADPIDMVVGANHADVGTAVCAYLIDRGHRRLTCLTGDDDRARRRVAGFLAEAARHGLETPTVVTTTSPTSMGQGRRELAAMIDRGQLPDAVFCSSDALANGCLTEALDRGLAVPTQLAVVGLGDLDFAAHTLPSMTTVRIDGDLIGRLAAAMLDDQLSGRQVPNRAVDIGFEIVVRASA
ncbi:substrate-binding domain-containing protein [Micromonospora pallida]|uniref:substrate-binding domain-containing protein n=1 Tax=Micromonospora pallida TaxID=145854 RepID=UPI00159F264C|nr:substrate-binding domain-containing protein [Micromonospora pallida]